MPEKAETVTCQDCGKNIEVIKISYSLFGQEKEKVVVPTQCDDCIEKGELAAKKAAKVKWVENLFDSSQLGKRFRNCRFDNWRPRREFAGALQVCKLYAANFNQHREQGTGLILTGTVGTGKTHLVAAIAHELLSKLTTVVFQPTPLLLQRIKATYKKNATETEMDLFKVLSGCDLLILDDVGAEKWTEWMETTIYSIIDERYRQMAPVIITTNKKIPELRKQVGERSLDRLVEVSELVDMTGKSFRLGGI